MQASISLEKPLAQGKQRWLLDGSDEGGSSGDIHAIGGAGQAASTQNARSWRCCVGGGRGQEHPQAGQARTDVLRLHRPLRVGLGTQASRCSSQGPGPSPALLPLNTRLVGSIHGRLAGGGWPLCPAAQLPLTWHPLEHPSHLGMAAGSSLRGLPPTWPASSGAV